MRAFLRTDAYGDAAAVSSFAANLPAWLGEYGAKCPVGPCSHESILANGRIRRRRGSEQLCCEPAGMAWRVQSKMPGGSLLT